MCMVVLYAIRKWYVPYAYGMKYVHGTEQMQWFYHIVIMYNRINYKV